MLFVKRNAPNVRSKTVELDELDRPQTM